MRKRPTYADVARRAGVSATTVSFVLNGRAEEMSIPKSTCDRVLAAAREIGYRPNRLASSLAQGRTNTVGVIVPRLESNYCANIVHGIQEASETLGSRLMLGYSRHDPDRERDQADLLLEHRVDALIIVADEHTSLGSGDWLGQVSTSGVPVVVVDEARFASKVDCVVPDDSLGVRLAMEYLLGKGHRRIGHIAGPAQHSTTPNRLWIYRQLLQRKGIALDDARVVGRDCSLDELPEQIDRLLALKPPCTAVFAANDVRAAYLVERMHGAGLKSPDDIEVVGFGNLEVSRLLGFTSIDQDPQEMGRVAARRALERVENPGMKPQTLLVPVRLVERDGTPGAIDYRLS